MILPGARDSAVSALQSVRVVTALASRRDSGDLDFRLRADGEHGGDACAAHGPRPLAVALLPAATGAAP